MLISLNHRCLQKSKLKNVTACHSTQVQPPSTETVGFVEAGRWGIRMSSFFFSHGEHMEWLKGLLLQTAVVNVPLISF